jgi:heterodisulfide reductase subunit A2
MEKCIACGACTEKCPPKIKDEYNEGLATRKAIYVMYPQAVPLKYVIDKERCLTLGKGKKCKVCEKKCPAGAVNFEDKEREVEIKAGSIILAPGFKPYNPTRLDFYGYERIPNVITSLEFERILSASGPFLGHLVRPSDHKEPKRIAWLQCIGSRNVNKCDNGYCSSVCCMYAIKEAIIAKEHSHGDLDCSIFYMDMRTHGKDFDKYMMKAESQGVKFIRAKVNMVEPLPSGGLRISGFVGKEERPKEEEFDLVVLSVGLDIPPETIVLAKQMGIELTHNRFNKTGTFNPVETSKPGIFACGAFNGPKDIPISVMEASAAACAASSILSEARNTMTAKPVAPAIRNIAGEPPRVGVFVCNCGINIGGIVKVPEVVEYARQLPHVVYAEESLFSCSQDSQEKIKDLINKHGINRVVVAACSPRTHEPLFQETLEAAGLNKYLFEMANIRNQNSWVHSDTPEIATEKAKDLIRMSVAKSVLLEPLAQTVLGLTKRALVIGGGIAGMNAAKEFSRQGYEVALVEKSGRLGGHALRVNTTAKGEDVATYLAGLTKEINEDPRIKVHLTTVIANVDGFVGNFKTTLRTNGNDQVVEHGVAVIATGASEFKPTEYLYGKHERVITQTEFDERLKANAPIVNDLKNVVFIQCVGSRETERPYCSKVCCTHSVHSAIEIKKKNPDTNVYVLYRDIRTYGEKEELYKEARGLGVIFVKYTKDNKPVVQEDGDRVSVTFTDHILGTEMKVRADLLILAAAIVSNREEGLAQMFKVPMDADGWFLEAHQKLRPVDFATDGVFMCGLAHYPKSMEEAVAQAQAAVARAVTILSLDSIVVGGVVSSIDKRRCSGCGVCITLCPFQAIKFDDKGKAEVNVALCKGCGVCITSCRSGAPDLMGFTNSEIMAQLDALEEVFY